MTCGSVDDGKSTLIGRLLYDTQTVLQDQLAGVTRASAEGQTVNFALLTDGLSAEREQGITIDVAYRYFSTAQRKFIIGDAPGHEQYTRNMVTAASNADAAVILVDATKLDWTNGEPTLLPQTRRHALLAHALRVPHLVVAVNKLDAVDNAQLAFERISQALHTFAQDAQLHWAAVVPVSALKGWNVVDAAPAHAEHAWCQYHGPTLLQLLEGLPSLVELDAPQDPTNDNSPTAQPLAFAVQWVEKAHHSATTAHGRRVFWGRVATGHVNVGDSVRVFPSGHAATVAQVLNPVRQATGVGAGCSAGVVLSHEVDISRGDWLLPGTPHSANAKPSAVVHSPPQQHVSALVAWLDTEPLVLGRAYWALHGHRWVKAKVHRVVHRLNIADLSQEPADTLQANSLGLVELVFQEPLPVQPYALSRALGALILVDTASHRTVAGVMVQVAQAAAHHSP